MARRAEGLVGADLDRLWKLLERPHTVEEICWHLGAKPRTVYRYLEALEAQGRFVVRLGASRPTQYRQA